MLEYTYSSTGRLNGVYPRVRRYTPPEIRIYGIRKDVPALRHPLPPQQRLF